jgi:Uri superfamily endonuclease
MTSTMDFTPTFILSLWDPEGSHRDPEGPHQGGGVPVGSSRKSTPESRLRDLPYAARGSYLLIICLDRPARIRIGAKGVFSFPAGWYLYAGSAKRGLRARIERHLRSKKKMRWHIDYLLRRARILDVITFTDHTECELAALLLARGGRVIVPRFGSSDCRCPSHLAYFRAAKWDSSLRPDLSGLRSE